MWEKRDELKGKKINLKEQGLAGFKNITVSHFYLLQMTNNSEFKKWVTVKDQNN